MEKQFNPGDRVRCLEGHSNTFTKGKIYIVREYPTQLRGSVGIFFDDLGQMDNGLPPEFVELVTGKVEEPSDDSKKT